MVSVIAKLGQISLTRNAEPNRPKKQGNELGLTRRSGVRCLIPFHQQRVAQVESRDACLPLVSVGLLPQPAQPLAELWIGIQQVRVKTACPGLSAHQVVDECVCGQCLTSEFR